MTIPITDVFVDYETTIIVKVFIKEEEDNNHI
jgi:hypothetical protein